MTVGWQYRPAGAIYGPASYVAANSSPRQLRLTLARLIRLHTAPSWSASGGRTERQLVVETRNKAARSGVHGRQPVRLLRRSTSEAGTRPEGDAPRHQRRDESSCRSTRTAAPPRACWPGADCRVRVRHDTGTARQRSRSRIARALAHAAARPTAAQRLLEEVLSHTTPVSARNPGSCGLDA